MLKITPPFILANNNPSVEISKSFPKNANCPRGERDVHENRYMYMRMTCVRPRQSQRWGGPRNQGWGVPRNQGLVLLVALLGAFTRLLWVVHPQEGTNMQPSPNLLDERELSSLKHFPGNKILHSTLCGAQS